MKKSLFPCHTTYDLNSRKVFPKTFSLFEQVDLGLWKNQIVLANTDENSWGREEEEKTLVFGVGCNE